MAIIASALARIKSDPLHFLGGSDRVNRAFADAGHVWRKTRWDPATTLGMFILQILHQNTAIAHLRHLANFNVKSSSYCEARMRLPMATLARVIEELCGESSRCMQEPSLWLGRRVFISDATNITAPDEPALQSMWPQPSSQKIGCGFPALKLLGMLDLVTGMIVHLSIMCANVHELSQCAGPLAMLKPGDVLLGDCGLCSFWHIAMLLKSSVDAVFRIHQHQTVDFTPDRRHRKKTGKFPKRGIPTSRYVRRLGHEDHLVEWAKPPRKPEWMTQADYDSSPEWIGVREFRYRIVLKGRRTRVVTIATTLADAMLYTKQEIAKLYDLRWEIEINFRHLKTTMKMEHLKCQTVDGVLKELMIFVLVYNLIRAAMTTAGARHGVDSSRISFVDAMRWLRSLCTPPKTSPGRVIDLIVNRPRPERWCPRVIKRRMKPYDLMTKPRNQYAQPDAEQVFIN